MVRESSISRRTAGWMYVACIGRTQSCCIVAGLGGMLPRWHAIDA